MLRTMHVVAPAPGSSLPMGSSPGRPALATRYLWRDPNLSACRPRGLRSLVPTCRLIKPRAESSGGDWAANSWATALAASAAVAVALASFAGPAGAAEFNKSKNDLFDPMRYTGRWYEVASLKRGFAGEGQQDCHCTQGVYTPREMSKGKIALEVNTFCVHGSPQGRISGIQGQVTCAPPAELKLKPESETSLERKEMIEEKCALRFPAIPFIPPEPYDVIRTDYDNYALVQGAVDTSFVQIYSRKPNPGKKFIEQQKKFLKEFGYPVNAIRDTPQDCPVVSVDALMGAMGKDTTMESMMTNTMPSSVTIADIPGVEFAGPRNIVDGIKDFVTLLQQETEEPVDIS